MGLSPQNIFESLLWAVNNLTYTESLIQDNDIVIEGEWGERRAGKGNYLLASLQSISVINTVKLWRK